MFGTLMEKATVSVVGRVTWSRVTCPKYKCTQDSAPAVSGSGPPSVDSCLGPHLRLDRPLHSLLHSRVPGIVCPACDGWGPGQGRGQGRGHGQQVGV